MCAAEGGWAITHTGCHSPPLCSAEGNGRSPHSSADCRPRNSSVPFSQPVLQPEKMRLCCLCWAKLSGWPKAVGSHGSHLQVPWFQSWCKWEHWHCATARGLELLEKLLWGTGRVSGGRLGCTFAWRITSSSQHRLCWHFPIGPGIVWDGLEGLQAPCVTMWEALACTGSFRKNYKERYFRDFFWFACGRELKQHFEILVLWDILNTALLFLGR